MRGTLTLLNKWDARWLEIAGVVRVVAEFKDAPLKWARSTEITEKMFKEAGIIYDQI